MNQDTYSKETLDARFDNLSEGQNEIKNHAIEIKAQVKMTNGRVGELEKWRSYSLGAISVITLLIVPILIYVITHWIK